MFLQRIISELEPFPNQQEPDVFLNGLIKSRKFGPTAFLSTLLVTHASTHIYRGYNMVDWSKCSKVWLRLITNCSSDTVKCKWREEAGVNMKSVSGYPLWIMTSDHMPFYTW